MAGEKKIQIAQINSISTDGNLLMVNFWDPKMIVRTVHHVPSTVNKELIVVDREDVIRLCAFAFPENNAFVIRFNKHIYEAIHKNISKDKFKYIGPNPSST